MKISVILPSLNPNEQLLDVVRGLVEKGFEDIIIVNDGSDEAHMEPFKKALEYPQVTLLTHEVNRGKGRALKTAYSFCIGNRPDIDGVVTVDGDNQHRPEDIYACCERLMENPDTVVLGCRDFTRPDVPWKSSVGNNITKFVFRAMCRIKLSDTQTGLRAIPAKLLPFMNQIEGERFEYETRVLLEMKRAKIPFIEQPIETVYIEDNSETHFHPVKDSFKIYRVILRFTFGRFFTFLKFSLGSVLSFLIDIGIFYLIQYLLQKNGSVSFWKPEYAATSVVGVFLENAFGNANVMISTIPARVVSSIFNFCFNYKVVFKKATKLSVLKYYTLVLVQMLLSGMLVTIASYAFGSVQPWQNTLIKLVIDSLLFFGSYVIQHHWVFASAKSGK